MHRLKTLCSLFGSLYLAIIPAPAKGGVAFIQHSLPSPAIFVNGMIQGPDGAMWFTETNSGAIGHITLAGEVTIYQIPGGGSPYGMTVGPDGALWVTMYVQATIVRITMDGTTTSYVVGPDFKSLFNITTGPDGALWFTASDRIGRITTDGVVTSHPMPSPGQHLNYGIVTGPDGALWFTESAAGRVGRITTSGEITEYPLGVGHNVQGITVGPDGALWVTVFDSNNIVRLTTNGNGTIYDAPNNPFEITTGPDGALWFTEYAQYNTGQIGRITTKGTVQSFLPPPGFTNLRKIALAPNGSLWFTEEQGFGIGQVVFPNASLTVDPTTAEPGGTLTLTGNGFGPGETVNLYENSTVLPLLGTTTADANGNLAGSQTLPSSAYGANSIVGIGQASGHFGVAAFLLNPAMAAELNGDVVTTSGFGFTPGDTVLVYWDHPRTNVGTVTAGRNGSFAGSQALTFQIPVGSSPGTHVIAGVANSSLAVGRGTVVVP